MESKRSKYILIGLSVFCILLIGITSFKDGFLNPLRSGVGYVLNPIQSGVNRVGTSLYNGISNYSTLHSAMAEKQALQERIDALVEENSRLQSEQFELSFMIWTRTICSIRKSVPGSLQKTPVTGSRYSGSTRALRTVFSWMPM